MGLTPAKALQGHRLDLEQTMAGDDDDAIDWMAPSERVIGKPEFEFPVQCPTCAIEKGSK